MKAIFALFSLGLLGTTTNEFATTITPTFSVLDVTVNESAGSVRIGIYKSGGNGKPGTITVTETDGTAKNGSDYTRISGRLTFQNNDSVKFVTLPIINDNQIEPTESFNLVIGAYSNAIINRGVAKVTIVDDDTFTCADGTVISGSQTCPVAPLPPPTVTWTHCADENGICYVVGTANVRYGADTIWTLPRQVTGSIGCNNNVFGDPFVGRVKECVTDGTPGVAPAPSPAPTPTPTPVPTPPATPLPVSAPISSTDIATLQAAVGTTFHTVCPTVCNAWPKLDPTFFTPINYTSIYLNNVTNGQNATLLNWSINYTGKIEWHVMFSNGIDGWLFSDQLGS